VEIVAVWVAEAEEAEAFILAEVEVEGRSEAHRGVTDQRVADLETETITTEEVGHSTPEVGAPTIIKTPSEVGIKVIRTPDAVVGRTLVILESGMAL
jgi:hypothetical protein